MMEDILKAILGGAGQAPQQSAPAGDPFSELLEGILGGGGAARRPAAQPQQSGAGGLMDILGSVLGGGRASRAGENPMLAPIAMALAEKLGISPQMAQTVVSFAFAMLLSKMQDKGQIDRQGRLPSQPGGQKSVDLDGLLDGDFLQSSGFATQLANETGMDEAQASESLQEALLMLSGSQSVKPRKRPSSSSGSLDHLLDNWD